MELLLFRHSEYKRLYNCSRIHIEDYPLEKRRHPVEGIILIVLSLIYYVLYIPCFYGIWKHAGRNNPCYSLLLYISVADLAILWIIGTLHGWLTFEGAVFCSHPLLSYVAGCLACETLWAIESTADIILALNRCVDVLSERYSRMLFAGRRIWAWLALPTVYGVYNFFFSLPAVYSDSNWFFNPFIGYLNDTEGVFVNYVHSAHNILIAVTCPSIYALFLATMLLKRRTFGASGGTFSALMNNIFMQVFAVSALNAISSFIYIYMQYVSASKALMVIGHFGWLHIHGFPPVIYLLLNQTICNEAKLFCSKIFGINIAHNNSTNRVSAVVTAYVQNDGI